MAGQRQLTQLQTAQRRSWVLLLVIILLWVSVLASGLAVVYSTHLSRQLFARLDLLKRESNDLHVEWGQYLLEQSTWSAFDRIESVAANQLQMHVPGQQQIVIVKTP